MGERGRLFVTAGLAGLIYSLASTNTSQARVQEYQILRLLTYKSDCQLARLEDRSTSSGPMRFLASCENVSFYPDGIEIICDDRDDDRSCRLVTKEKSFDQLHLLDKNFKR